MNITAAQVKELRERTGAGMMECKKVLVEANGDIEAAIEIMRKSGRVKAAKKAGRIAAEGIIAIKAANDNKTAIMVEVNTETDFAARDESFKSFVDMIITSGLENQAVDLPALLALPLEISIDKTIAQECEVLVAKIGENIQIRRMVLVKSAGIVGAYCHGGRIGVLVELSSEDLQLGKDLAMHIAASDPEDEQSLLEQPFVKNPSISVGDLLNNLNAKVLSFVRFQVGEGIEKETTEFAKEVMAQIK